MRRVARRTTPKVVSGKVQRKNRSAPTPSYWNTPLEVPVVDRERPGPGHRHVLLKRDITGFVSILPDWSELSRGLDAVLLARGGDDADGWYNSGIVAICAWPRELWIEVVPTYYRAHAAVFKRLDVPCRKAGGVHVCEFNESTVKAFQLLHVFLHELGHHHDRMTSRLRRETGRGESYAEQYAHKHEKLIWDRYWETFGW